MPRTWLPWIQLLTTALVALTLAVVGTEQQMYSAIATGLLMTVNWALLAWSWGQLLQKKSFALAASVIVLKYALLGTCVVVFVRQPWADPVGLGLGVGSAGLAALTHSLIKRKVERKKSGSF